MNENCPRCKKPLGKHVFKLGDEILCEDCYKTDGFIPMGMGDDAVYIKTKVRSEP